MTSRQVVLEGGSPWGFRIHGGCDIGLPIKISRVNPGSKAAQKGLREGDIISSINESSTKNLDNSTAHSLLRNAGEQLRLSLNEDGLSSPRRRLKQTIITATGTEQKTPSGEIVCRKTEIRKFENGKDKVTEKVEAEVHAEQTKGNSRENVFELKMPRKNKKPKTTSESKSKDDHEKDKVLTSNDNVISETNLEDEKPERKGLFLSLDKKLKLQVKKQKKKEKKREFEAWNKKIPEKISVIPNIEWELATELEEVEKAYGTLVENVVQVIQVEVMEDAEACSDNPEIEEEKNLRNFLREIMEANTARQGEKNRMETQFVKNKFHIETIPEDLFEEFIENEEKVQTREAIKAFPRTSPLHLPNTKKREPMVTEPLYSPPKVFYNYQGVSYIAPSDKSVLEEDVEDGIVVINTFRNNEPEIYPRTLDVIQEESSDFSDASGHSEKKSKMACEVIKMSGLVSVHPVVRETVKIFSLNQKIKDGVKTAAGGGSYCVQPVIVEKLKMSDDVVKIELAESESESDINQYESSYAAGKVEIVSFEDASSECAKMKSVKDDYSEKSVWSVKSVSSNSTKLPEEGSESWRSSLNDEVEADVESELESQRALIFNDADADDELSLNMSDLLDNNGVEIFITNFKKVEGKDSTTENDLKDPDNSLNQLLPYEVDEKSLFQNKFFSNSQKSKQFDSISKSKQVLRAESDYSDKNLSSESTKLTRDKFTVKDIAESIKNDMDKILLTKMKVIRHSSKEPLSESSWVSLVNETKKQLDFKNCSSESDFKELQQSDSSSYENVPKYGKVFQWISERPEKRQTPEPLSNLAEKKVLTLPYGKLVLQKIGLGNCCSKNSESNKDLEEEIYVKTRPDSSKSSKRDRSIPSPTNYDSEENEKSDQIYVEFDYSNPKLGETEKWYGMRTGMPAVFVGLSPSQKKIYEQKQKKWLPNETEADSLLDLHQKFMERRSYHETNPWNCERNLIYDSSTLVENVSITETGKGYKTFEKLRTSQEENMNVTDKVKEKKIARENVKSLNKVEPVPRKTVMRLVGNEKSQNEDGLLKVKCCSVKDYGKESCNSKTEEKKEGETNTQTEKDSEVVGKSRLLAILQNAISDEFVPELNTDSSIICSSENHEVFVVQNQEAIKDSWQKKGKFESASKPEEETSMENSVRRDQKTFQDFWNKEKNYCSLQNSGASKARSNYRPKTICCENESELYINEPKFVREIRTPKKMSFKKTKADEKEELIITENLPAVSDVIKSFEQPKVENLDTNIIDHKNKKTQILIDNEKYQISKQGDIALIRNDETDRKKIQKEKRRSMPASILSERELFKQKMYDEYMSKLAERTERRQQKIIRVSQSNEIECPEDTKFFDLENEFISKVKERKEKLGIVDDGTSEKELLECLKKSCLEFRNYWEGEISNLESERAVFRENAEKLKDGSTPESNSKRSSIQLLDTSSDLENLPKHLKELLQVDGEEFPDFFDGKLFEIMPSSVVFSPTFKATAPRPGIWSPAQTVSEDKTEEKEENEERKKLENEPIPPVWTPKSSQPSPVLERKEFRPVNFESPTLPRKKYIQNDKKESSVPPPWQQPGNDKPPQLAKSPSSPALSLPKAPNPTVTLLQKAREGHLPRGAHYLNSDMNEPPTSDGTTIEKVEIVSSVINDSERSRRTEVGPKKVIGIGPTTKEGIPLVLRSEVTEGNKEKWYKRMYDSLHKYGKDDDYVTVKYRTSPRRRGLYNYQPCSSSGYQSEPESLSYDLSSNKYITLDRRRNEKSKENECIHVTLPRSRNSPPRRDFREYKNQPGRIEDYEPGRSSISELEANKWWDEVLEIFDKWLDRNPEARGAACNKLLIDALQSRSDEEKSRPAIRKPQSPRSFTNYASGYISDPQYVYKRTEEEPQSPPSSEEQKEAYRIIQKGGEIPLKGLRKPAPERPKDSFNTEIEYFPLSPTLTRIRVHKQNITPLRELPFSFYPSPFEHTTLNYPTVSFGVCSSFSQVQLFPPPFLPQVAIKEVSSKPPDSSNTVDQNSQNSPGKEQKFSVQLQNISGPNDYVQIVPKPRSHSKKSPIYANIPVREKSYSPSPPSVKSEAIQTIISETGALISSKQTAVGSCEKDSTEKSPKRGGITTFSDLKRIAPSINSAAISRISISKIPTKQRKIDNCADKSKELVKKKESSISKLTNKSAIKSRKTDIENKENSIERKKVQKPFTEKNQKKEKKKVVLDKSDTKKSGLKVTSNKVPLSESIVREKPLAKTNKRLKTFSENLKKRKTETKSGKLSEEDKSPSSDTKEDIIEYLSRFIEYSNTSYVDLKNPEEIKTVSFLESEDEKSTTMSPVYEAVEQKPKVESDITEAFRSRSFSPDVKRKIFKLPDMNKPVPPKRKESKISPTLKMWSKMMVSYPRHKSRLDAFDSNVKFLGDRIKRKLADNKDTKDEFGDNIETVRTVKKDKNGDMSIKTNRYVRLTRPLSSDLISARATYPNIGRRRLLAEPRTKFGSADSIRPRKYSDASTISKSVGPDIKKPTKQKLDTVLRSSTTYSVRNPAREEDDKRKSVKVTVAISSKGKELLRKSADMTPSVKKTISKSSSSPCPSISSFKSGVSGKSDKGSTSSSQGGIESFQTRLISPNSSLTHLSSSSRSISPGSAITKSKISKSTGTKPTIKKPNGPPIMSAYGIKPKSENKKVVAKIKSIGKTDSEPLEKQLLPEDVVKDKHVIRTEEKEKVKKLKRNINGKIRTIVHKKSVEKEDEMTRGRDLVRTDSFFQNLFLRGPIKKSPIEIERTSSVLERARRYQFQINWPETYKSEPSLSLVSYYLNQKRPVSLSKFRNWDRELSSPRFGSPLGSFHSENFQKKLRRFDSVSQFGDGLQRDFSPEAKERSSSEPPLLRSHTDSPEPKLERKSSRISLSEASSMRSSPNSSRSPSCRRIQNYKSSFRNSEGGRDVKKFRARSAGEVEDMKSKSNLQYGDLGKSSSSLNLSNLSDHAEYQAYILELMHSTRKCERFRELHKFYSNLEKMGKLEKTASTGDLRPRLRNEEIIDFERWKKIRTKERAEAELKTLVDNLVKVQKEKDLLFRAADIEVVRWKGDSGLRIKERSVEDLKEQFNRYSEENIDSDTWKKEIDLRKDHYKPLWRGSSIVDVASNLNNTLVSHRGRPITLQELEKIEKSKARIGKEYGYSLKAWSSLSNEQVNALKDQLSEIYIQDAKRRYIDGSSESLPDKYEILVPKDRDIQSPGESSLQVRCSSALSKSQTYTPTIRRKEEVQKEWKKANSISVLPANDENVNLPQLPWKDDTRIARSHSEGRTPKHDRYPVLRSKSASSSKPLSESEKKRLSMTLSKEVIEKMTKAGGKGPLFPRETLGALAAAGSKLREYGLTQEKKAAVEKFLDERTGNENDVTEPEIGKDESRSGSSETSVKTVIRKNSMDVLKKVQYFEELHQSPEEFFNRDELREDFLESQDKVKGGETKEESKSSKKKDKKRNTLIPSSSMENLNDYFGQQKQYATSPVQKKRVAKVGDTSKSLVPIPSRSEDFHDLRNIFDDKKFLPMQYYSTSPLGLCSGSSNESLFSYRSRSVSPDPTKYYRAYLRMVKCGAVRKLCNKFESWEDLLSLSSDKDFWLPPPPRRFASDPELTRDLLKRFGTDPTKVTIRGQEVGDVRWLRTKFEKNVYPRRGRSRFRRVRSPLMRSPLTFADRFMPRINVISKTAELQMQGLGSDRKKKDVSPSKAHLLAASPEEYKSLIDYTKDHGGYYYTGEVEKLKRKFERLQEAERLSILGQMYTSTPDVNELRDIAPYLECSWIAHRYPEVTKTVSTSELQIRRQEPPKKSQLKPRPHSSSPIRPKQPSSILKPSCPHPDRGIFADQKFDPSIHRPKYRYQPEREVDRRYKRGDPDWWRHWSKPTVTFKESVSFKAEPEIRDLSPESPRKYVESEVTIHYKSPVRSEAKAVLSEDELARRQAESMKRIYKEERRRKYLQELQDMNSRRHTDNFIPSQKSPISLNRYDDFLADSSAYSRKDYTTDPVLVARGLYDFVGRRPRELGFRRGDIIFIIRKLDKNWCEGELNGVVGLFPLSYVEVIPYNEINLKYGRARAKYNFIPQTPLELLAHKGDMIVLLRKIDENWFEGRIGERTGIIPASYCHVLAMPQASRIPLRVEKTVSKPVAAPAAHSLIHNGSGLSSKHYYTPYLSPSSPGRSTTSSTSVNYHDSHPSADMLIDEALMQLDEEFDLKRSASKSTSQPLNVRINPRPEPELYQVLFNHVPNNDDELELVQGETITVIEKCGDGWYIGSKADGKLGIFPGTHARRIAPEFV